MDHTRASLENRLAKPHADLLIVGAAEVLTCASTAGDPAGRQRGAVVAIGGDRILAVANPDEITGAIDTSSAHVIDARGGVVAPGFVDSHTHLVFGGSRAAEYAARLTLDAPELRNLGIPTGIPATVSMTRAASSEALLAEAQVRLRGMLSHGTTTVESKSGYGLSTDQEVRLLQVNHQLQASQPIDIVSTFLGAHDVPPGVAPERYVEMVIAEMIPAVTDLHLAEFCDVYCDEGYFSQAQSRRILEAGRAAGLGLKIHADAYANIGAADLAADLRVVSADHLNYTSRETMRRLARNGVAGVVMPALDFAVHHPQPFDSRMMLREGMTVALATDLCPACWVESMILVIQLACRQYQFSPAEAVCAATLGGARALALSDRGILKTGYLADVQIWNLPSVEEVVYRLGHNPVSTTIKRGRVVHDVRS